MTWFTYAAVAVGGALGSVARFWVSGVVAEKFGEAFPLGTLVVNVTGSFTIGFLAGLMEPGGVGIMNPNWRQFLMVGVCGGYTTFSSFSLETVNLLTGGDWTHAGWNVGLSVVLCLGGVRIGHALGVIFNHSKGI